MSLEKDDKENKQIREEFCPICIAAVPLAFSMAGASTAKATEQNEIDNCDGEDDDEKEQNKIRIKYRNTMIFSICGFVGIISIIVIIYFMFFQKCDDCEKVLGNKK
jgi:hypothetical protein